MVLYCFEYCSNKVQSALCWVGLCKSTNCSVYVWFPRSVVCMYPVFCVFWILRNVNFCVFRSFKVLVDISWSFKVFVDISWKCVVKISIQHYCGTLLFEYCSNDVQPVLCWVGLCKSTDWVVYFWFPHPVFFVFSTYSTVICSALFDLWVQFIR